jgi:hypothetical protein
MTQRTIAWAVSVLDRAAGRHPAWEAPPPLVIVEEAEALLRNLGLWDYTEAILAGNLPLPRMTSLGDPATFETRFRHLVMHDVRGWWSGVVSGKPVNAGSMTAAFVQRAGGEPNVVLVPRLQIDAPRVSSEARVRVVDAATWQVVIPRGVMRGENSAVEIVGGEGHVHQETIRRSAWRVVGGWKTPNGPNRVAPPPADTGAQKAGCKLPKPKLKA